MAGIKQKNLSDTQMRRLEELEQQFIKRTTCEERALQIVHRLLSPSVSKEFLQEVSCYIDASHYSDVVEERAISKQCGYPICSKLLVNIPKQKYHISTKSNKVYDITERKNFCSSVCYKSSKLFQQHLSSTPLWLKDNNTACQRVKLSSQEDDGGWLGIEVIGPKTQSTEVNKELERLNDSNSSKLTRLNLGCEESSKQTDTTLKCVPTTTTHLQQTDSGDHQSGEETALLDTKFQKSVAATCFNEYSPNKADLLVVEKTQEGSSGSLMALNPRNCQSTQKVLSTQAERDMQYTKQECSTSAKLEHFQSLLKKKKNKLVMFVQMETLNNPKDIIETDCRTSSLPGTEIISKIVQNDESLRSVNADSEKSFGKSDLCVAGAHQTRATPKRNSRAEERSRKCSPDFIFNALEAWMTDKTLEFIGYSDCRPVQDNEKRFSELKIDIQGKQFESLLSGEDALHYMPVPNYDQVKKQSEELAIKVKEFYQGCSKTSQQITDNDWFEPVLPTVDTHSQMVMRRDIVMDRLNKILPELLQPLDLSLHAVFGDLKQLVLTFNLGNKNILFQPAEWTFVGLILLKMLSRKEKIINIAFRSPQAISYFDVFLQGINSRQEDLDKRIKELFKKKL